MGQPHFKFWGTVTPVPLGLRPCMEYDAVRGGITKDFAQQQSYKADSRFHW